MTDAEYAPYVPKTEYGLQIVNNELTDPVEVVCLKFDTMFNTVTAIELALALRLGADNDEFGIPIVGASTPTWDLMQEVLSSTCTTNPKELFAEVFDLSTDSPRLHLVVPLPVAGYRHKAVTGEFSYGVKATKTNNSVARKLGRNIVKGRVDVRPNPFYEKPHADTTIIRSSSVTNYVARGTLGYSILAPKPALNFLTNIYQVHDFV